MTNCGKCGAELIGSRKFCAACGAPTDPSSLKRADPNIGGNGPASSPAPAPAPQISVPSTAYGPPMPSGAASVNPFAATASPSSRAIGSAYGPPPATTANPPSNPPPGAPGPLDGTAPVPPVSPLAVSNALSQRGAFQQATAGERIPPPPASSPTGPNIPAPAKKVVPGTQIMPSMQNPALGIAAAAAANAGAPSQAKPPPQRTQVMDAASFARPSVVRPSSPNQPAAPPYVQPPQPPQQPPPQQPPPSQWGAPVQSGWGAPVPSAPVASHGGYGFGYAPGARVNVTWSNGQRYPATVSQVSGTQVLVAFPDGQQHWVEMQYLTPA